MTFTKEQLIAQARGNVKALKMAVVQSAFKDIRPAIELDLALAELALAGMEAEPVGFIARHKETGKFGSYLHPKADWFKDDNYEVLKVYDAPQLLTTSERAELENYRNAQQVVPELKPVGYLFISDQGAVAYSPTDFGLAGFSLAGQIFGDIAPHRAAMLQGKAVSQPELPSREHFIFLCNQFWNWQEFDEINAGEEEPRLEWDGKEFTHRVTQALWRMYQAAPEQQSTQQNIPENIPVTLFKPVADLYGLTSPTCGETSFTFDAVEAREFIDGGWSCQEYVELERYQAAMTNHSGDANENGNSPVIPDGWVACSDRMPEQGDYVSAVSRHGEYVSGQVIDDWLELHDGTSFSIDELYLWMPLPSLPAAPQQEAE